MIVQLKLQSKETKYTTRESSTVWTNDRWMFPRLGRTKNNTKTKKNARTGRHFM